MIFDENGNEKIYLNEHRSGLRQTKKKKRNLNQLLQAFKEVVEDTNGEALKDSPQKA